MKKHIITLIAIILGTAQLTYGQTTKKDCEASRLIIGATGGFSSVSGNFVKNDYNDPKAGFATSGYNLGLTGTWFINKSFGISALLSYHAYGFNGLQSLADGFHDAFDVDSASASTKGSNYTINFLIGPYYSLPLAKKLSLDGRILAGIVNAHLAGNTIYLEDNSDATFSQKTASATTFGIQAGLGLRYNISRNVWLMLNGDYFYSKPNFSIEYENRHNTAGRWLSSYNEAIAGVNANLSIGFSLAR